VTVGWTGFDSLHRGISNVTTTYSSTSTLEERVRNLDDLIRIESVKVARLEALIATLQAEIYALKGAEVPKDDLEPVRKSVRAFKLK